MGKDNWDKDNLGESQFGKKTIENNRKQKIKSRTRGLVLHPLVFLKTIETIETIFSCLRRFQRQ